MLMSESDRQMAMFVSRRLQPKPAAPKLSAPRPSDLQGEEQMNVLKTLVEDFGGEATCASLSYAMGRRLPAANAADLQDCIRQTLRDLDESGAVDVEQNGPVNLIARITPNGIVRWDEFVAETERLEARFALAG